MPYREFFNKNLKLIIEYIEIFIIIIAITILFITISKVIIKYFYNINYSLNYEYIDIDKYKLFMLKQISFLLSFVLAIEILKIFYIRNYRHLVIIGSLGILKLIMSYYIAQEIDVLKNDIKLFNYN
jgi:hypothetical protein